MNKNVFAGLFFLALASDLVCIQWDLTTVRFITKPLLVLFLVSYLLAALQKHHMPIKRWVVAALGFSWLGDVFLLFETANSLFFMLGLASFLLAHIAYILFFKRIRSRERLPFKPLWLFAVAVYYIGLIWFLGPGLGALKVPVWIYGATICIMLGVAVHLYKVGPRNAGVQILAGAVFFVVSDSLLAINKFYQPFPAAGISIMFTYGLAQWFITEGSIRWITKQSSLLNRPNVAEKAIATV